MNGHLQPAGVMKPLMSRLIVAEEVNSYGRVEITVKAEAESLPEARNLLMQDLLARYMSQVPLEVAWPTPDFATLVDPVPADPPVARKRRKPGRPRKAVK